MNGFRPTLKDIIADEPLNAAEKRFVENCKTGEGLVLGDSVPSEATKQNTIRASLIRHMMLGGCADMSVASKGGRVQGAWITGVLDLECCESKLDLRLENCKVAEKLVLVDAHLGAVYLPGCHLLGLMAHRLKVTRAVQLSKCFKSDGTVDLSSANIGLSLSCVKGHFDGKGDMALNCNAMTVGADVFLSSGFNALGEVNLVGAQIAGQFSCIKGCFDGKDGKALDCYAMVVGANVFLREGFHATGEVKLKHAQISGSLLCQKGIFEGELNCEGMTVGGGFFWQGVKKVPNVLDLTDAHVGSLRDDRASWKDCTPVLNGFRYDRLIGDMSDRDRLEWLSSAKPAKILEGKYFNGAVCEIDPQPYTQLAKVFDNNGARRRANLVRYERTLRVNKSEYANQLVAAEHPNAGVGEVFFVRIRQIADWLARGIFGFGYQLERAFIAFFLIWAASVILYSYTYKYGQMAPNSAVILTSAEWQDAAKKGCTDIKLPDCTMPLRLWEASHTSTDYETFNRYLYALDLFVPLDALGQENAWAPSKDRGWWGYAAYSLRWLIQMSGWVITAVGAAALTGFIGKRD